MSGHRRGVVVRNLHARSLVGVATMLPNSCGSSAGTSRSRPRVDLIRRPQSISMALHEATNAEQIVPGDSSPAPCSCVSTRASGTPSLLLQTAMSGMRRPMPASRLSRGPSPARVGTDRASLGYIAARSQGLRRKRQHQTTSDVLFGRPSRIRLALHKVLSSAIGSEDHEACRSQAPTLRDLHPQIDHVSCCTTPA